MGSNYAREIDIEKYKREKMVKKTNKNKNKNITTKSLPPTKYNKKKTLKESHTHKKKNTITNTHTFPYKE